METKYELTVKHFVVKCFVHLIGILHQVREADYETLRAFFSECFGAFQLVTSQFSLMLYIAISCSVFAGLDTSAVTTKLLEN